MCPKAHAHRQKLFSETAGVRQTTRPDYLLSNSRYTTQRYRSPSFRMNGKTIHKLCDFLVLFLLALRISSYSKAYLFRFLVIPTRKLHRSISDGRTSNHYPLG